MCSAAFKLPKLSIELEVHNICNPTCENSCRKFVFWQAGYVYDEETFEKIFRRIYASFGSSAPYTVFPDSQPFLRWLREQGLKVGIVSNAEYRYQDVILPALGLNEVNFHCFSKACYLRSVNDIER